MIKIEMQVNDKRILNKINNDRAFWMFGTAEWNRLYSPYVPMQTGNLMEHVTIRPKEIHHNAIYAGSAYNSNRNFRKDKHPLATGHWDTAAEPMQKPKLIKTMQNYINAGRLKLND